jgi:GNAT superfamily N-acetyltransferase
LDDGRRICQAILLAVDIRFRRRGLARRLRQAQLDEARQRGMSVVVSTVHFDNDPMIELNSSLGGKFSTIAGDSEHLRCVIALRAFRPGGGGPDVVIQPYSRAASRRWNSW